MSYRSDDDTAGHSASTGRRGVFRQVAADLRRGRSIELYVTIAVSVTAAVLGVLNVANVDVIGAAVLAFLALLATSGLTYACCSSKRRMRVIG
ncbi:hypothetical protein [Catelliglobosispora koreensis]|uniref:hypothetical protein n=1 Tax=Catelliglobosispora koreensis TaxID=129052 RepID=UPI000371E29E|nr:hypothetical protein [Catelliglobosispora koreensis]